MKILAFALAAAALPLMGQTARSPFLPPAGVAGQAGDAGQHDAYELAGASTSPEGTQICLFDTARKHSRWLKVGGSEDGIQVVSYDEANDQAVVRFDGSTHVLALRKVKTGSVQEAFTPNLGMGQVGTAQPLAGTSQAANAPIVDPSTIGKSPETIKQEREARMLVSDLLEISIAQRKAYEEAQKKAAAQAAAKKSKS